MFDPNAELDYSAKVDEFRCRSTEWLHDRREWLVREQRRLHVEELAVTRVLDERGAIDDSLAAADGISIRDVRDAVATARALEDLPTIAQAAAEGRLSDDQLTQVVKVADTSDEHVWAEQAPAWSPKDLAQKARELRTPTAEDMAARRAARRLALWWRADRGMLGLSGDLPDVDGALVESVFDHMVERMKPAKGQPWESRERRAADALVELCRNYAHIHAPTGPAPHIIVEVPMSGPATLVGIPLPDAQVEQLRAQARIEPVLVDESGAPVAVGKAEPALSEKTKRVVRQRDGKCRWPGCDRRVGLEVHHLWPRSWGGEDKIWNLATVCAAHHARLAPHGPLLLLGNPNNPGGLSLVDRGDLPQLAQLAADHARAAPGAA